MSKDNKINLKLEVFKDKDSGKLSLMAHFDKSAPNVYKEKDNFYWVPTVEEKDFLYEAFKMMPEGSTISPLKDYKTKPDETTQNEVTSKSENSIDNEELNEEDSVNNKSDTNQISNDTNFEKSSSISESENDIIKEEKQQDTDDTLLEEIDKEELKKLEDEQDKGLIVEADADAIDEAIKKHSKNDDSIVEADEQTIIDKVLSQKKKGRWSRK